MTKLKQIREAKRIRLREIAAIVKVTPQTVQQIEQKGIKRIDTAKRYAEALGVTWQEVIEA